MPRCIALFCSCSTGLLGDKIPAMSLDSLIKAKRAFRNFSVSSFSSIQVSFKNLLARTPKPCTVIKDNEELKPPSPSLIPKVNFYGPARLASGVVVETSLTVLPLQWPPRGTVTTLYLTALHNHISLPCIFYNKGHHCIENPESRCISYNTLLLPGHIPMR